MVKTKRTAQKKRRALDLGALEERAVTKQKSLTELAQLGLRTGCDAIVEGVRRVAVDVFIKPTKATVNGLVIWPLKTTVKYAVIKPTTYLYGKLKRSKLKIMKELNKSDKARVAILTARLTRLEREVKRLRKAQSTMASNHAKCVGKLVGTPASVRRPASEGEGDRSSRRRRSSRKQRLDEINETFNKELTKAAPSTASASMPPPPPPPPPAAKGAAQGAAPPPPPPPPPASNNNADKGDSRGISLASLSKVKLRSAKDKPAVKETPAATGGRSQISLADISNVKLRSVKRASPYRLRSGGKSGKGFTPADILAVKLRKNSAKRSPGGTPMKARKEMTPEEFVANALRKKFASIRQMDSPDHADSPDTSFASQNEDEENQVSAAHDLENSLNSSISSVGSTRKRLDSPFQTAALIDHTAGRQPASRIR